MAGPLSYGAVVTSCSRPPTKSLRPFLNSPHQALDPSSGCQGLRPLDQHTRNEAVDVDASNREAWLLGWAFLLQFVTSFTSGVLLKESLIVSDDIDQTMSNIAESPRGA